MNIVECPKISVGIDASQLKMHGVMMGGAISTPKYCVVDSGSSSTSFLPVWKGVEAGKAGHAVGFYPLQSRIHSVCSNIRTHAVDIVVHLGERGSRRQNVDWFGCFYGVSCPMKNCGSTATKQVATRTGNNGKKTRGTILVTT